MNLSKFPEYNTVLIINPYDKLNNTDTLKHKIIHINNINQMDKNGKITYEIDCIINRHIYTKRQIDILSVKFPINYYKNSPDGKVIFHLFDNYTKVFRVVNG